jgi:hypothetical protein
MWFAGGPAFAGSNAGPCTVWRISTFFRRVFRKRKKSGLFAEVRRFHGVTDGGVGKVVKKKGLDAQSCKQRTYGNKRTEHARRVNQKTIGPGWSLGWSPGGVLVGVLVGILVLIRVGVLR